MYWALNCPHSEHEMDRLHIKTGIMLDDGTIAIVARGRLKGMVEQISGLIMHFRVTKNDDGKYALERETIQRVFPSIFCRQLDFIQKVKSKIILT